MAIVIINNLGGATTEQYDESVRRLDEAGTFPPSGQLYHVCFGESGNLRVVDVFESQEALDKFRESLIPVLSDIGIDLGEPDVSEAHHMNS